MKGKLFISILAATSLYGSTEILSIQPNNINVQISTQSEWESGFCANITITNPTSNKVKWQVDFNADGEIYNIWSCNYTQDKTTLSTHISGLDWNRVLAPNSSTTVGYCANKVQQPQQDTPQESDEGLVISQNVQSQWDGGYCKDVQISNPTDSDILWRVNLEVEGEIYNLWNANYTYDEATKSITATGVDWNKIVKAGNSVSFGYCANLNTTTTDSSSTTTVSNSDSTTDSNTDSTNTSSTEDSSNTTDTTGDTIADTSSNSTTDKTSNFTKDDYQDVMKKSYLFYEAQRASGPFPNISWRNPACLDDGKDVGRDLSKGWFDAGDAVKFNLPMAYSATILELGILTFKDSYTQANLLENAKDQIKYALDYFIEAYNEGSLKNDPSDDKVYYQVADGNLDHSFWGPPEDITYKRETFTCDKDNKCSEVAGEMAAAMAAGAILFSDDADYSAKLLDKAKQIYQFASTYEGNNGYTAANPFYTSYSGYYDELAWAAIWLYKATGESEYLDDAKAYIQKKKDDVYWAMSWDNVTVPTAYLLYKITGDTQYKDMLEANTNDAINGEKTEGGLRFYLQWGSLRYAANSAFVALLYASTLQDESKKDTLINFARSQIDYILGDNPRGSSYIVGWGKNYPINPHHRASHYSKEHNIDTPVNNTYLLVGALVGGPKSKDDFDYQDDRHDYVCNEVATDYNAGFTGALAGLIELLK